MTEVAAFAHDTADSEESLAPRVRSYWQNVVDRLARDPVTLFFGALLAAIILAARKASSSASSPSAIAAIRSARTSSAATF